MLTPSGIQYAPRKCPWCGFFIPDPMKTICNNCGGPLQPPRPQTISGAMEISSFRRNIGQAPPPPPRTLPKKYINNVLYWGNVLTIIGMIFTIALCWTIIFLIIGIFLWRAGINRGRRELRALMYGRAVEGQIVSSVQDQTESMNGRHPWKITYLFKTTAGVSRVEHDKGWDDENGFFKPGDPVWIVYMEGEPGVSAIWPPIN